MEELKSCPFCGKEAELEKNGDDYDGYFHLGCRDHNCPSHWAYYTEPIAKKAEAIAAWNRRASGWVAVSERLPSEEDADEWEHVLARWRSSVVMTLHYQKIKEGCGITHWMPMPESPTKEG